MLRDLTTLRRSAVPHAVREALNSEAFSARRLWQEQMKSKFTLRNRYTARSVRVDKARGVNLASMQSVVGSVAPYAPEQEHGATVAKTSIPTGAASGERGVRSSERKKPVRRPNRKATLNIPTKMKGTGKRGIATAIRNAKKQGGRKRIVLLESGAKRGIFKVAGGKRKTKLVMLHNLSYTSVRKPPLKTLQPALLEVQKIGTRILVHAIAKQFARHGLPNPRG